jgi:hypothetical protein
MIEERPMSQAEQPAVTPTIDDYTCNFESDGRRCVLHKGHERRHVLGLIAGQREWIVNDDLTLRFHDDGTLDEIVAHNVTFHLEQMSEANYWFRVYGQEHDVAGFIGGCPIECSYEVEQADPIAAHRDQPAPAAPCKCNFNCDIPGTNASEWECPKCGRVFASPRVPTCNHQGMAGVLRIEKPADQPAPAPPETRWGVSVHGAVGEVFFHPAPAPPAETRDSEQQRLTARLVKAIEVLRQYFHFGQDGMDAIRFLETELLPWMKDAPPAAPVPVAETSEGKELPDAPGVWCNGSRTWIVFKDAGDLRASSVEHGFRVTWFVSSMPRGKWHPASNLTALQAENDRLKGELRSIGENADSYVKKLKGELAEAKSDMKELKAAKGPYADLIWARKRAETDALMAKHSRDEAISKLAAEVAARESAEAKVAELRGLLGKHAIQSGSIYHGCKLCGQMFYIEKKLTHDATCSLYQPESEVRE